MRILHVVPTYLPAVRYGGPIFAVHGLCRALAARGHTVEVFTTNVDGPGMSPVPIDAPVMMDGVQVRYFTSPYLKRLFWSPGLADALRRRMAEFDIVHTHSAFLRPTWIAAREAHRARVPYLLSPRGMLVRDLIQRQSRLAKTAWIKLIERSNLEQATAIHVTSDIERHEIERFGWKLPQIVKIANGVDDPQPVNEAALSEDVKELARGGPLVLFLGRISWKKGLDRLIRAFAQTTTGKLAIVGPDDENQAQVLSRLSFDLGLADRIVFLPRNVSGSDKEFLFAAARIFVLTSYSENFGNTILEAMRRGIGVVVTGEVGAAEIVRACGCGIVADGDAGSLAGAMNTLLLDPALTQSMGENGRRHAVESFGWPRVAAMMEEVYSRHA
jgi:glycosyltransferase involved in cell wall biosynthesis